MPRSTTAARACLVLPFLVPAAFAHVIVVPSGTHVQDAVDAAGEGDVLLLSNGVLHSTTWIQAKGLTLVANEAELVDVGQILVTDLAPEQQVTLAGLRVASDERLSVFSCEGHVRVVHCSFGGASVGLTYPPDPPVYLSVAADVELFDCEVRAYTNTWGHAGSHGIAAIESTLSVYDSTIFGANGDEGGAHSSGNFGTAAILSKDSNVFVSGTHLEGGPGGDGHDANCFDRGDLPTAGGTGGSPIVIENSISGASVVQVLDCVGIGGAGGAGGTSPSCGTAADGAANAGGFAPSQVIAGVHRSMAFVAPAREGEDLQLHFSGEPGDQVYLAIALGMNQAYSSLLHGTLLEPTGFRRFGVGTIDASGVLDFSLTVNELGPGVDARVFQAQAIFVDPTIERWVSGATPLVMLDASF